MNQRSDEIVTVEEVAKYLKLKPQTVYKWAQDGRIPGTKLGKEWRFRSRTTKEMPSVCTGIYAWQRRVIHVSAILV